MELKIVKFFNRLGAGSMDKVVDFLSRIRFLVIFWAIVSIAFFIFDKKFGIKIFSGIIVASVLHFLITEGLIKNILVRFFGKRIRPYIADKEIVPVGRRFSDSS